MRSQILERHVLPYVFAVADDVEVRLAEVDDAPAVCGGDVSVPDIPLVRDGPVEDLGAAGHLVDLERNPCSNFSQVLADSLTCDAATEGKDARSELLHALPGSCDRSGRRPHDVASGAKSG